MPGRPRRRRAEPFEYGASGDGFKGFPLDDAEPVDLYEAQLSRTGWRNA